MKNVEETTITEILNNYQSIFGSSRIEIPTLKALSVENKFNMYSKEFVVSPIIKGNRLLCILNRDDMQPYFLSENKKVSQWSLNKGTGPEWSGPRCILDGTLVILPNRYIYVVSDIISLQNKSLVKQSFKDRLEILNSEITPFLKDMTRKKRSEYCMIPTPWIKTTDALTVKKDILKYIHSYFQKTCTGSYGVPGTLIPKSGIVFKSYEDTYYNHCSNFSYKTDDENVSNIIKISNGTASNPVIVRTVKSLNANQLLHVYWVDKISKDKGLKKMILNFLSSGNGKINVFFKGAQLHEKCLLNTGFPVRVFTVIETRDDTHVQIQGSPPIKILSGHWKTQGSPWVYSSNKAYGADIIVTQRILSNKDGGKQFSNKFIRKVYKITDYTNIIVDNNNLYVESFPGESSSNIINLLKIMLHMYIVSNGKSGE